MRPMVSRNHSLTVVASCMAVLLFPIAAGVLAQQTKASQPSGSSDSTHAVQETGEPIRSSEPRLREAPDDTFSPRDDLNLFGSAVAYSSGGSAHSIIVADVNGDGKLDLLLATYTGAGVLLGNGDGTFQTVRSYSSSAYDASSLAVGDLNGDGTPDLVVAYQQLSETTQEGAVVVFLGNGAGYFQATRSYDSGGIHAAGVALADVNGDGKLDIVVTNVCPFNNGCGTEGTLSVLLGNGDGTFQAAETYGTGGLFPTSVVVADVNGDGKPDLVVGDVASFSNSQGSVAVLLGNGNGTFQTARTYGSGGSNTYISAASIAVADVNGDGKADVVVSSECIDDVCDQGAVGVLLGDGDGTFQTVQTYGSGGYGASGVAVADVNGDGKLDLLVANDCATGSLCKLGFQANSDGAIGVLLGDGDGIFQTAQTYDSGGWGSSGVAVGNLNGDGKLDLLAANACGTTCVGGTGVVGVLLSNDDRPTTITTLSTSADPMMPNQTVTYTATVQSTSGKPIAGTVAFEDSWIPVDTVSLSAGQATYNTSYARTGLHPITAVYSGDPNNAVSTSNTLVESITSMQTKTTTTLATSGSPSFIGQPVTLVATVTWNYGTVPDGELITFYAGTTALGTGATKNGIATLVTSSLDANTHTVKAAYPGDAKFHPSAGTVKQVVEKYSTTTALSSSLNPSAFGQAVTFTAIVVSAGEGSATGKVAFKDGTKGLGTAILSGGVANFQSRLAVGTHPISVQYVGDASHNKSTSSVLDQVVQ